MFVAASFIGREKWKQFKRSSTEEWVTKCGLARNEIRVLYKL